METDCSSEFGGSPVASEEDEEEPQDRGQLVNSLKNLNRNEVVKSKLSDAMDAVQNEDSGLTWEASSSRCSTSQASEASATSGVYSIENSYVDSPSEKMMLLMDEGKFDHRRTSNSPNQEPLSPNQKIDPDNDYSVRQMQEKSEEAELDPANPKSWPYQVQPSKIKDYLVQITQEVVTSLPEEKDNALKKKGELPLEGTVRARIQLITAVLEERNKKIFRRVNKKDVPPPPPPPLIRRPREPPKIFSRQGISVPLRHVEREATDKNNKKELLRYNLKHMQTNISKPGASVPCNKVERRTRRSFQSETQNKASEKLLPILPSFPDKANKLDTEPSSGMEQASFTPPDREDKMKKKEKHTLLPDKEILEKECNLLDETKKQESQRYLPVSTEVTDISEESSPPLKRTTAKPFSPASAEPLSYSANEPQNPPESIVTVPSDPTAQDKQCPNNIVLMEHEPEHLVLAETRNQDTEPRPSQLAIKDAAVLHSAEETGKEDISPHPAAIAESAPEPVELSHSLSDTEKQEMRQVEEEYSKKEEAGEQATRVLQTEPEHQHLVHSGKEVEATETELVLDLPSTASRTRTPESQNYPHKAVEEFSGHPQPTSLMGEAEKIKEQPLPFSLAKEAVQAPTAVTSSQEPECLEEPHLSDEKENQTAQLESQHPDLSLSSPEAQREEINQQSTAVVQSGSEHPVISEPVKAPQRSKRMKSSQLRGKEVSSSSPAEAVNSSEQLPFISSALTATAEKQETRPYTLITAAPVLEEQPSSDLPDQTEQMEKQDNPPYSPETPMLVSSASPSTAPVQPADTTEAEIQLCPSAQVPLETLVSVSRESDVAVERERIQPNSLSRVESPPEASVPFQEAVKLENQVSPPLHAKLYSEDEDVTHPAGDEGCQEGNLHLFESEASKQNINKNSSALSQLEETIALHFVDEADKKDICPDKSIPEPSHPDSLYPVHVPEKQERVQSEMGQTTQHLSPAVFQTESDILPSVKEMEIDGMQAHLPSAAQDLLKPACLTETQVDKGLPTGAATLDIPYTKAGAEKHDTPVLESKHMAKQIIQSVTTELEPDYPEVLPSVSESDLDISFPTPSTDLQSHVLVTPQSDVSSEKEREEMEHYSSITPTSELKIPTAGPETQESQSYSSDTLPTPAPINSSFLPVQIKDAAVPAESILRSIPPSEQSNLLSLDLKDKAEMEESPFLFPEMPKRDPEEPLSTTAFLIGEPRDEAPYSPMDAQIVPEESKSIPKDFVSEATKEMDLPPSHLPAEPFSRESIPLYAVDGEKQDRHHALLTAESKQVAAGKADTQAALSHSFTTAQSETKKLDIEPCCPVIAQSEQEDLTLLSTEQNTKQETPLHSFSAVQSEPTHQELLYDTRERDNQEKIPLEIEISKVQNAPSQTPIQQQVPECLNLLQSVKQSEMKEIQPSSFATVHDSSSQMATETETGICLGSLSKSADNDYGVSVLLEFTDKAEKQETQPLGHEAAQLECKQSVVSAEEKEHIPFPPVMAPLDQGHLDLFYSTEPQLSSPEAQNQTSEEPPSPSPLCPEKAEKQEVNSHSPAVSISSALDQSNSVLLDLIEETEQQKIQPSPPEGENVTPEEHFSIAAFLLSEAKKIETSLPLATEKDNVDTQSPFEEAGLLIERSNSAVLPEMNVTIKKEIQPSLTHFESQQLSSKPHAEVADLEKRENIPDMPTIPNFIVNKPSNALLSEPINDIHTQSLPSQINSVDSDKIEGKKAIVITAEELSKTEEIPCLSSAEKTLQKPENDLQKEKELNHQEKLREESISAPELDTFNTSEDYKVVSIHAPPFISSADEEENKHTPERLEYLETVSSLQTKPFRDVGDAIVTHESSMCKLGTNILEGLTEDIHENKASESKEMVGDVRVQRNVETEKEGSACPEKKNDSALNDMGMDYLEKYTLIDDRSFTQRGKEQSAGVVQRLFDITKENSEEATALPESSKNTLDVPILERDLDEGLHEMAKRENTAATKEETSKVLKENELIDDASKNKNNKEDELNLAGVPLFSTEKDVVAHSPLTPVQDTTLKPELLDVSPASEETTALPESSKNTLDISILERDLDKDVHEMVKTENTAATKETSKILKEDELIDVARKNKKNKENELNLAGVPLFSTVVARSPLTPVQDTTLNPELLDVSPALSPASEETTALPESSKNTLDISILERDLDKDVHEMVKTENTAATKETSKISKEDELIDAARKNKKNKEDELNLAGVPLFSTEKDVVAHSPLTPVQDTTLKPELLDVPPALSFLYTDLYEEVIAEPKNDSCKHPSNEEMENTNVPLHSRDQVTNDGTRLYLEKDIPKDDISNNLVEFQKEQVLKDQPVNEQDLSQTTVSQGIREPNEKVQETLCSLAEAHTQSLVMSPGEIVKGKNDALTEGPTEIASDIKVTTCQPTLAVPFGSRLDGTGGASNDESSQSRGEEYLSAEAGHGLPEETSDEESSPILDYAATIYPEEASVQPKEDESKEAACLTVDQHQQSVVTDVHKVDNYAVTKPVEETTQFDETFHQILTPWENEGQLEDHFSSDFTAQDAHALDHDHHTCQDAEETSEERVDEYVVSDLMTRNREAANQQYTAPEVKSDIAFGELDYSLLTHDFDTYPLYSIKEEEYSDIDEDLAELMDDEMVAQDHIFHEETPSEVAREDDRKSLDHISNEFVNEREANTYAEEEEFELRGLEKLQKNVPESEVLQKEIEQAQFDTYCYQCKCLIFADDKLWGNHKEHNVTNLDTAATELKSQLGGFLDVLQERSLKIEGFVSEIEALFNSLEENCKGKEQLLEEQNERIINAVIADHDKKAQSFEDIKNTKMEYLYEQMVNFQEYVDTAKETLETIVKETEEMDDFVFLRSSEDINKRLLSAVENIQILEKMPASFSEFEHYADNSANGDQTLKHMPVPQTPKLQQQDPNSATSTSISVYWTVNEEDVIDFFQVYCMEEHPENKEQSGLVEEYRVTVKESNCTLEDLEPGHSYSVWVMAVNYTGCSFPSNKSSFRTAPPTPVIKAEDCTVCWDTATIRWSTSNSEATESFTLEYCRQYSPEGEGLRSLAGIKKSELKVKLEPNVNYFFYVRAVNNFGTSEQSEAALISTKGSRFHIMKETAHPPLQVSANGTVICLPEETKLTGRIPPVLGELLSARGWHYWEITVSGCSAYKVGICYSTAPEDNVLGQNKTSWCLHCSSKTSLVYKVLHNGEMSDVIVTEQPVRIGILLDYNAGRLLFFNAERGQVLFAIRQKFTNAAHPAFVLEQPGVLHLHTGMELPEFVKYS